MPEKSIIRDLHGFFKHYTVLASKSQCLQASTDGPSALTEKRDVVWIPSKGRNVVFDPL